jgi:arsenical pump membrane protein
MATQGAIWTIAALATGGVILRPWRLPEALWAAVGAGTLVASSLLPWRAALRAVGRGTDVYLFLSGMMLLAELARQRGVFQWLAERAVRLAKGSTRRLFSLVFVVAVLVTAVLSNDATAVVLTPAVLAATKKAQTEPMPYLFICAFVANAASFLLPISNPANLVVFGGHMPALPAWLATFAVPSLLSIAATYLALRLTQRHSFGQHLIAAPQLCHLSQAGQWTLIGIGLSAVVLITASAFDFPLGLPTFAVATLTTATVLLATRESPWPILKGISWSVLPLVAGLFVLVEGLSQTGVIQHLSAALDAAATRSSVATSWTAAGTVAIASNLINNLPAGLIIQSTLADARAIPDAVTRALLVAVDLGPNFSVTGSLATLLWLVALRREGKDISAIAFLRVGIWVTIPALALALLALNWAA